MIRRRLRAREPLFGAWTSLGHPSISEMLVRSGVDFLGIDLEHSTISQAQAQRIIAAAQAAGAACFPRLPSRSVEPLQRLLDSGADGVIVPNVSTLAQVRQIVEGCKYPPLGKRSYGVARAQEYGFRFEEYAAGWNDRCAILLQIESIAGIEAAEELLADEAVDGAMAGPYDLSGSMGLAGQLEHPKVRQACGRLLEVCRRQGKACGTQIVDPDPENVRAALDQGYTFLVLASDVFLLWKWGERMRALIRSVRRSVPVGSGCTSPR